MTSNFFRKSELEKQYRKASSAISLLLRLCLAASTLRSLAKSLSMVICVLVLLIATLQLMKATLQTT